MLSRMFPPGTLFPFTNLGYVALCFTVAGVLHSGGQASAYEGFGATTPGGSQGEVVHVTNLNDSGSGSLRQALSRSNRRIVFDVGGEILLNSRLYVKGANVTIDGFTAPSPGITIKNYGLRIHGTKGAHDIIVQGIRVRITSRDPGVEDGISISAGAYNVVIDHVSVSGASDESVGIADSTTRDITVSWSILAEPITGHSANMLISYAARRVSVHHNLFITAARRNPWVDYQEGASAPETQADVRNNLMWDVSGSGSDHGTAVFFGGKVNVVNNYYKAVPTANPGVQKRVIVVCKDANDPEDESFCVNRGPAAGAYVAGNFSHDGWTDHINTKGTEVGPFPAPVVDTTDACTAAQQVLAKAGVRPLDALDSQYLSGISLAACGAPQSARLDVASSQLNFAGTLGGPNPASQTLTISELNGGNLSWTSTVTEGEWFSVSPTNGTTPSQMTVVADTSGLPGGPFAGKITISAVGAANSPVEVPVTLAVEPPVVGGQVLELRVADGVDDAEEANEAVKLAAKELQPGQKRLLAFRFTGVTIPQKAVINSAVLKLYAAGNVGQAIAVRYLGERVGDSAPFAKLERGLTNRPKTDAFVDDTPQPWQSKTFNASPDLSAIVQEIVDQPGWVSGNSLTVFIADNGSDSNRVIKSFETDPNAAAVLAVTYE